MVLAVNHGAHCDAELRADGCVCTDSGKGSASRSLHELADHMRVSEHDARAKRDWVLAAGYNHRADAFDHASVIAAAAEAAERRRVEGVIRRQLQRIRDDEHNGMATMETLLQRRVLVRVLVELGWWDE